MIYDLLIIGGGINGSAIARDAAGRGLKVLLVEQNDLASATSSASTKLIHGGLRYLEQYEFKLVREALLEREILLVSAPHIIRPLKFVIPHARHLRPRWLIRLGLWLYDHLAIRKRLPKSESITLKGNWLGAPLNPKYETGFTYADCWVDDSRLVVLNAVDARDRGATIKTHTKIIYTKRHKDFWEARTNTDELFYTKVIVNAAGPWVSEVLDQALQVKSSKRVKLVKGSHIVVNSLYTGNHAYLLQNHDNRIAFVIPYEGKFTLIGTTDVQYDKVPGPTTISATETEYLLDLVNQFWRVPITQEDIVSSYSGLRPLYDDGEINASVVTRDYAFDINRELAPVLTIFGGKITTARRLAEHALEELNLEQRPAWTSDSFLPGGETEFKILLTQLRLRKSFLSFELSSRLARAYGTRVYEILGTSTSMNDLGQNFGCDLTEAEVKYLVKNEWATCTEDIIWRRSKLGLHLTQDQINVLDTFVKGLI